MASKFLRSLRGAGPAASPPGPPTRARPPEDRRSASLRDKFCRPAPASPEVTRAPVDHAPGPTAWGGAFAGVGKVRRVDALSARRAQIEASAARLTPSDAAAARTRAAVENLLQDLARPASQYQVRDTPELQRILALPRRPFPPEHPDQTLRHRRPGGTMELFAEQSACLAEAEQSSGAYCRLGLGAGKTLVSLLLPAVIPCERAALLVPASMREPLKAKIAEYERHFDIPMRKIAVVTYRDLSDPKMGDILDKLRPDLIVLDEGHSVSGSNARSRRFRRYAGAHPECRVVVLTGTPAKQGPDEYGALMENCLRDGSPVPRPYGELREWSAAVGRKRKMGPGALRQLCRPGEDVTEGFGRRVYETPGVVSSADEGVEAKLVIEKLDVQVPPGVRDLIERVREDWELDGEVCADPAIVAAQIKQLACGFYYRPDWPGGVVDVEWVTAKRDWHRAVRERVKLSIPKQDSESLCARAARSGKWKCPEWVEWDKHSRKRPPPTKTIWLDDFLVLDCVARAEPGTIIWCDGHLALQHRFSAAGLPVYGAGTNAELADEPVIVCSVGSQGEGKNLQKRYHRNIVTCWSPDATRAQQMIGRTHRRGQVAPVVWVGWYAHVEEHEASMVECRERAAYAQRERREPQRVLYAEQL